MLDIEYKLFDYLTLFSKEVRTKVFIEEQGFSLEFDDIDDISIHVVGIVNGKGVATARLFQEDGEYKIGRVCVLKEYRGKNIASNLLKILENKALELNASYVVLSSQVQSKEFYKKNGYFEVGEIYLDEFCPHIKMIKKLK